MQVIAKAKGFDGAVVREPGDTFEMPADAKGSWFEPVEAEPETPKAKGKAKTKAEADGDLA
jgi:hypothetical protein